MFSLLHPAALWTLAALALPLAIHLRRPPPRTVRLGSLRALENIPRRPWRHPRWRELLLLWTRLGLLAVLTLWLAGLRWIAAPPTGPRRWALLDPTAVLTNAARTRWQGLRDEGYEGRLLAPDFPGVPGERSATADAPAPDLWSLLREADAELPAGSTLAVFSPGRLAALRGVRPALAHCRVEWVRTDDAPAPLPSESPAATPRAVSVLILHDTPHTVDARYVEAAVRAAADSLGRPINVQVRAITPDAENAAATDWTFWLSAGPIPGGLAGRAPQIVRYAGGEAVAADGFIVAPGDEAADSVKLHQRTAAALSPASTTLWTDGQGNPLLTYTHPPAAGETWELFTRFDPVWNDLPRTGKLAAWVRTQLFSEAASTPDRRLADPTQGLPADATGAAIPALAPVDQPTFDLHWALWTVAALLFAAERTLSLRRQP